MNRPDTPVQAIAQDILGKQFVTNLLGLDTRQLRPLAERPKHGKADRSNPSAQIERLLYRRRLLQRIPSGSGIINPVAMPLLPLENPVRPNQA